MTSLGPLGCSQESSDCYPTVQMSGSRRGRHHKPSIHFQTGLRGPRSHKRGLNYEIESLRSAWPTNNTASLIDHDQFDRVTRTPGREHLRDHPVDLRERRFNLGEFRHYS